MSLRPLRSSLLALLLATFAGCDPGPTTAPPPGEFLPPNLPPSAPPPPPTDLDSVVAVYDRISPSFFPGTQRFVIRDADRFVLFYPSGLGYGGKYVLSNDTLALSFDGWSIAGPWEATAVLAGNSLSIRFNLVMLMSDFEDGVFIRVQ